MVGGYVADAAHVRRQMVDLVDIPRGDQAIIEASEVEYLELVGRARIVFGILDIDTPHPVVLVDQVLNQMVPYKASGTGNQCPLCHVLPPNVMDELYLFSCC